MDNCQVTINLTLASPGQHRNADQLSWPLGMRLYTSKKRIGDDPYVYDNSQQQQQCTQRRADAEIPENLGSKPKHEIGGELIEEAAHSGLDFGCVLGESNFGKSPALRRRLRK